MADLAFTAAKIAAAHPTKAEIVTMIAAAAITAGQSVYQDAAGKADLADASVAGTAGTRGIALQTVGAGQAVDVLKRGYVEGFTLTQAYDAPIYQSDTAGDLADAAGTVSYLVGIVAPLTDKDITKALYVDLSWND